MKDKYIVRGTPIVPSVCGIGMAVLWYLVIVFGDGEWTTEMKTLSFADMTGVEIYMTLLGLSVPVLFFVGVLFLVEKHLRWMILAMLPPIVYQISIFILNLIEGVSDYIFRFPVQFVAPFLVMILFILTIEKVIPTKWVFVGFCGVAVLLPLILTLCGIGEFTYSSLDYDDLGGDLEITYYFWSEYLGFALYYIALGALAVQMRFPRKEDLVTMADLKQAYAEKMAAEAEAEAEAEKKTEAVSESAESEEEAMKNSSEEV